MAEIPSSLKLEKGSKEYSLLDKKIGANIKILRNIRGYSQSSIASAIGVTFQQFQKYESGVNRLYVSRLMAICKFCNISIIDFFYKLLGDIEAELKDDVGEHHHISHRKGKNSMVSLSDAELAPRDGFVYDFDSDSLSRLIMGFKNIRSPVLRKQILDLVGEISSVEHSTS
ncbi:helix-turn-helix transcriptional regulator [Anaplasmataceae bacterium AB001_6]|nr:helix-turn-helix transcriptional regulator [Anaplasmataceae bacterium AB001_6]